VHVDDDIGLFEPGDERAEGWRALDGGGDEGPHVRIGGAQARLRRVVDVGGVQRHGGDGEACEDEEGGQWSGHRCVSAAACKRAAGLA
jgi:hypothetical protein